MHLRILFVGDIHLGRSPARLPEALADLGLRQGDLGPAAAWRSAVAYACHHHVDAVVLAGDVVESDNARFEAFGHLQSGVDRLLSAGIEICAVAGNHDVDALPRLAGMMPDFHLLGAGGAWSTHVLQKMGSARVRLVGWSFPDGRVLQSPLRSGLPEVTAEEISLGVLHCDLGAATSRHAPVRRAELVQTGYAGWFLGHIHKPETLSGTPPLGYLGSLVGLDPTETGLHGPSLATISPSGEIEVQRIPLAPLRWEHLDLDVTGMVRPADELAHSITKTWQDFARQHASELATTRAIGCRLRLTGRTAARRELAREAAQPQLAELLYSHRNLTFFIDKIENEAASTVDLARLAQTTDPPGMLARDLLALERGGPEQQELILAVRQDLQDLAERSGFGLLEPFELGEESVRRILLRAGRLALDELMAQQEVRHAAE